MRKKKSVKLNIQKSYLAMIHNSVGAKLFRNLFFNIEGKVIDVLDDGDLSCAVFVTIVLHVFKLVKDVHTTVVATLKDMEQSGWHKIRKPKIGAIILWDYKMGTDGAPHMHMGFYVGKRLAISNRPEKRAPAKHHWTFGLSKARIPKRKILAFYWHDALGGG